MADMVIDLDKVVPEDVIFKYRGEDYRFPGDIDADTVLVLVKLVNELARAEGHVEDVPGDSAKARRVGKQLDEELLKLFQVNHPQLERLPFGAHALSMVVGTVLTRLGFMDAETPKPDGDPPTKARAKPKKARSRRSSTSSRSRKS